MSISLCKRLIDFWDRCVLYTYEKRGLNQDTRTGRMDAPPYQGFAPCFQASIKAGTYRSATPEKGSRHRLGAGDLEAGRREGVRL